MAEGLEAHGEVEHVGHVLGGTREHVGRQDVDQGLVLVEPGLVGVRDLRRGLGLEPRGDQHPVLAAIEALVAQVADVRDVLHVEHRDAVVQQGPAHEVGQQVAAQIADVGPAVHRRAAGVHPDGPVRGDRHGLHARVRVLRRESPLIVGASVERASRAHRTQQSNANQHSSLRSRWSSSTRSRISGGSWARCHRHSRRPSASRSSSVAADCAARIA